MLLRDVHSVVTAHFNMTNKAGPRDNKTKFAEMICRRLEKGQCFHTPYLGTREFPAKLRLISDGETPPVPIAETRSLGLMLYDIDYIKEIDNDGNEIVKEFKPKYFLAELKNGIINLRGVEVLR
jgi:CRISPR-associated protein Cas5d